MSHTPGPWAYDADSCEVFGTTEDRSCGWVAKVVGGDSNDCRLPDDERVANARLVACAPEMLDALRMAADALDLAQAQVDSENDRHNLCKRLVAVKRVIAKAEGSE